MSKYFTRDDQDNLIFFKVPKILIIGEKYRKMKPNTKMVYILLLDRIKLSMSNGWLDDEKYYVRLTQESAEELLGMSESTYKRCKKELKDFGLLEEIQEGLGKPNKLFPMKLSYTDKDIYLVNLAADDAVLEGEEKAKQAEKELEKRRKSNPDLDENLEEKIEDIVENIAENIDEQKSDSLMGQNEPSQSYHRMGQNEPSYIEPMKVQNEPLDGSKRTTNNNNFNNNYKKEYIKPVNKSVNNAVNNSYKNRRKNFESKESTRNRLIEEYLERGMNEGLIYRVCDEVEQNEKVENYGGYLRTCLETAFTRSIRKVDMYEGELENPHKDKDSLAAMFFDEMYGLDE